MKKDLTDLLDTIKYYIEKDNIKNVETLMISLTEKINKYKNAKSKRDK